MSAEFGMRSSECEGEDFVVIASVAKQSCLFFLRLFSRGVYPAEPGGLRPKKADSD